MKLERFEMIDDVESIDEDNIELVATAQVPKNSSVFEGHFPGHPLVPGVLLIETMAQASGFLLLALNRLERMPFLASVKQGNFRTFVLPETHMRVYTKLEHDGSGYAVTKSHIEHDGKKVCDATLFFRLTPFPNPEIEQYIRDRAQQIGLKYDLG